MAIHVALTHTTRYTFPEPVQVYPHVVRLRPAPHCRTPISAYSLRVQPESHYLNWQQDAFGNYLARMVFTEPTKVLEFVVDMVVDLTVINPFDFFVEETAEHFPFAYAEQVGADLGPYLVTEEPGPLLAAWLDAIRTERADAEAAGETIRTIDFLTVVNQKLMGDIAYSLRLEPGVQSPEETLKLALGSCRDTGWLLVQILRHLGLAARFVSGYLVQLEPDEKPLEGPAGPEEDFTDLHAWCEVYIPGAGWIGLDPTSGLMAGEGHIPLAATPSPSSAAPIEGATGKTEVEFFFANEVTRIHEDPRSTKPYDDDQWQGILALGAKVDESLVAGDVRLTMGGEPTFVSIDDFESPQWTIAADGEEKREKSWALLQRLADRFATSPLIQHGQGKWYPGEPLPRWQMSMFWRPDGQPLWYDPELLADPWAPGKATIEDARQLADAIATGLDLPTEAVMPAWEDQLYQAWMEARQPQGDPPEVDLATADELTRAALARKVDALGDDPAGFALPIHKNDQDEWATTEWKLRRGRLVLTPGDSPMGLRLPIDALNWLPVDFPPERSTFEPRGPLPSREDAPRSASSAAAIANARDDGARPRPDRMTSPDVAPPTSVGVELREGRLHVFLPPLTHADDAIELVGAIEDAATAYGQPVVIEGYGLPSDPRLQSMTVAPDPGVIEVNVHPTSTWDELVEVTTGLYEDAKQSRLATERFDLDGSHTGTGGGNHLTLGGSRPSDSPLLRRPDVLASMLAYWQRHPAMSYLFSSKFVGATSQAPRVDEARDDRLYELEIAFTELRRLAAENNANSGAGVRGHKSPEMSEPDGGSRRTDARGGDDLRNPIGDDLRNPISAAPAWQVDRALRHLLTDLTGNTHRSEFCIDKLYSPDSERGRLGLLELRGFEMPPHAQMGLVQALLVRSLVDWFWKEPYEAPLVRWGTGLHDKHLLPHFCEEDIRHVAEDLQRAGTPFQADWFAPFTEFRFPRLGTTIVDGVQVELRGAIEPWDVLGEEATAGGTARYVDSSVERLQVKVQGLIPGHHMLLVNNRPLPLHQTGVPGEAVAGVRYRAWQPPSALHPTIGIHAPIRVDVLDVPSRRSLGGCTYYVSHPGGLNPADFPLNAIVAESRRQARFEERGHTPGRIDPRVIAAAQVSRNPSLPEHPVTLDLRRPQ